MVYFCNSSKTQVPPGAALLTTECFLPSIIVFVCMLIQMWYIRKIIGQRSPEEGVHANITVFLISTLFFVCNTTFVSIFSAYYTHSVYITTNTLLFFKFAAMAKFTMPLINAALFPFILIMRKEALRSRYKRYILSTISYPITLGKIVIATTQGYEQIS